MNFKNQTHDIGADGLPIISVKALNSLDSGPEALDVDRLVYNPTYLIENVSAEDFSQKFQKFYYQLNEELIEEVTYTVYLQDYDQLVTTDVASIILESFVRKYVYSIQKVRVRVRLLEGPKRLLQSMVGLKSLGPQYEYHFRDFTDVHIEQFRLPSIPYNAVSRTLFKLTQNDGTLSTNLNITDSTFRFTVPGVL